MGGGAVPHVALYANCGSYYALVMNITGVDVLGQLVGAAEPQACLVRNIWIVVDVSNGCSCRGDRCGTYYVRLLLVLHVRLGRLQVMHIGARC